MNPHEQRFILKQLAQVKKNADNGIHLHKDYATLVNAVIKLVKNSGN